MIFGGLDFKNKIYGRYRSYKWEYIVKMIKFCYVNFFFGVSYLIVIQFNDCLMGCSFQVIFVINVFIYILQ